MITYVSQSECAVCHELAELMGDDALECRTHYDERMSQDAWLDYMEARLG